MRSLVGLALAAMLAVVLAACDDGGGGDECEDVIDACTEQGVTQCSGDQVQQCMENADGCLVWTPGDRCGDNQSCTVTGGTASCECDDTCETDGDSQCDGSVVQECGMDSDGCLVWDNMTNCETSGQSCDDSTGDAECVGGCESDCSTEGDTHCTTSDVVETCTDMGSGCLQWRETTDCTDTHQLCEETGGTASCVTPCTPDCEVEDDSRCSTSDDVETCTDVGDGCLQWQVSDDCDDTTEVCDATTDPASCVDACMPTCDTADAVQCNADDNVETCTDVGGGCLQWQMTDDCDDTTEFCDATLTPPACALVCVPDCTTVDATQCGATSLGVETCTDVGGGCLQWVLTADCAAGFRACDDTATPAVCGALTAGDSCGDPILITADSTTISGTDFTADFADDFPLGGTDCVTRTGSAEAVLQVDLAAGEGILLRELGGLDAVLSLQTTCGDAGACAFSDDLGETTGHRYQATAAETVYLIVEAYSSTPSTTSYEIRVDIWTDEDCGDGLDNDLDGVTDCDDSDCFGDATSCATETNCGDGFDNDDDGATDCADTDCATATRCMPIQGIWELFDDEVFSLEGTSVTFTPDPTDPQGYTWAFATGVTAFPETPGGGTATTTLSALGDDNSVPYTLSTMGSFPFYGTSYTTLNVGSNGHVTFGSSYSGSIDSTSELFARPTIAFLGEDVDPSDTAAGDVTVDDYADRVVITFDHIPFYDETVVNDVQVILRATGVIEMYWVSVPPEGIGAFDTIMVGITSGVGVMPYPPEVHFYDVPEDCGDSVDNDFDGLVDCDDPECFGDATSCATETNCSDGADNDGDGDADCLDADCASDSACAPPASLTINEISYDGPGTDNSEFIELYGTPGGYLGGYTLVHWNGGPSPATVVWEIDLSGISLPTNGYLVIGSTLVADTDFLWADFGISDTDAIQNGGGDAVVLYSSWDSSAATGTVADAVAYEGSGNLPAEAIETTASPGVGAGDWATSIGRYPDGTDTDVNSADVLPMWWPTPGAANPGSHAGPPLDRAVASVSGATTLPLAIPDNVAAGVTATIDLTGATWFPSTIADLNVGVMIDHTWRGDLIVSLTSPDGTTVTLHNLTGSSADDIYTVYDLATAVATGSMDDFNGETGRGVWTLTVSDNAGGDVGQLVDWFILAE